MVSRKIMAPTRRLVSGSNTAMLPPKSSSLALCTRVITCISPWAPTGLAAMGLKRDSIAITAKISLGSSLSCSPTTKASATSALMGSLATRYLRLSQLATRSCSSGSACGSDTVTRSTACGSTATSRLDSWRSSSQAKARLSMP